GNSEPQHIGEVVPGVGHQRHGIGEHAVDELHRDERQVEADADREGHAEARGSVAMGAPVLVMIGVFMHARSRSGRMHPPRCYTKANDGQLTQLTCIAEKHRKLALDQSRHAALGCLAMAWLIQKSAALVAVYSIALQAVLWGFAPAGHFGFDP